MAKIRRIRLRTAILLIMAGVLVLALFTAPSLANVFLKKTADNIFSVGLAELTVKEDNYPENEEDRFAVPNSFVPKDPRIVNTGTVDIYVFARVTVPCGEAVPVISGGENANLPDPDGARLMELFNIISEARDKQNGADTDGFAQDFTITDTGAFSYQSKWIFLSCEEDIRKKTHSYLFGYGSLLTAGDSGSSTTTIFDKVQLRNILEGSLPADTVAEISIDAFGIQSDELRGSLEIADPRSLTKQELEGILTYYRNQEG